MEIGAAIFFTDYSITPTDLAVALEERGFDSLWVAEHSHIPVSRRFSHPQGEAALVEVSDQLAPVANRSCPLRPPRGLTPEHQVAADLRVVKTLHVGARQ